MSAQIILNLINELKTVMIARLVRPSPISLLSNVYD